jgi:hypothetical protein
VQLDVQDLRQHYASLADEALLALNRSELTPMAQQCYDEEIAQRRLDQDEVAESTFHDDPEIEPDWVTDAACACSFGPQEVQDLEQACEILEDAGVPCHVSVRQDQGQTGAYDVHEVMVPAPLHLLAISVLDKEMFNPRLGAEWKAHLEELSDEDFNALNPDDLTAGFIDRAERLKRAYREEQARRDGQ